jgi:hypothetical protein
MLNSAAEQVELYEWLLLLLLDDSWRDCNLHLKFLLSTFLTTVTIEWLTHRCGRPLCPHPSARQIATLTGIYLVRRVCSCCEIMDGGWAQTGLLDQPAPAFLADGKTTAAAASTATAAARRRPPPAAIRLCSSSSAAISQRRQRRRCAATRR